jgi:hypothetical protein
MALTNYSVNKLHWWAIVDDTTTVEITRVETHFALNSIPTCVLHCAIGRDVRTLQAAAIHFIINDQKINLPITVMCQAAEVNNSGTSGGIWPLGPFTAFDGRIVGTSFQKTRTGGASLMLYCRHWLMDLEYAVTNTRYTHPLNTIAFNMQAALQVIPGNPNFAVGTLATTFFSKPTITSDFWGDGLKPWLKKIINLPVVFANEEVSGPARGRALAALSRIEPDYQFGIPIPMVDFAVLSNVTATDAIAYDVANETFKSFYGQTIWEKLVGDFASRYMFALVPMAERALIVPFIPGLKDTWVTVDPSEYETISLNGDLPYGLSTVVIYTGLGSLTGAVGFQMGQGGANNTVGGLFKNKNMPEGMFIFRDGPEWLTNAVSQFAWAAGAAPVANVVGNMGFPGAGAGPAFEQPMGIRLAAKPMWDAYAKSVYLYEVLKNRRGAVSGKVRFDIAPGSSIEVICAEEKFISAQSGVGDQSLFAMVTKVSTVYDSEACNGQTTIEFGFFHDEVEHEDPNLTTDNHPIWDSVWPGGPEVEDFTAEPPPI